MGAYGATAVKCGAGHDAAKRKCNPLGSTGIIYSSGWYHRILQNVTGNLRTITQKYKVGPRRSSTAAAGTDTPARSQGLSRPPPTFPGVPHENSQLPKCPDYCSQNKKTNKKMERQLKVAPLLPTQRAINRVVIHCFSISFINVQVE